MGNLMWRPRGANPNDGSYDDANTSPLGMMPVKRRARKGYPGSLPPYRPYRRSSSAGDLSDLLQAQAGGDDDSDKLTAEQLHRRDAWRAFDAAYTGGKVFRPEHGCEYIQ